jgi:hypothetical protein
MRESSGRLFCHGWDAAFRYTRRKPANQYLIIGPKSSFAFIVPGKVLLGTQDSKFYTLRNGGNDQPHFNTNLWSGAGANSGGLDSR